MTTPRVPVPIVETTYPALKRWLSPKRIFQAVTPTSLIFHFDDHKNRVNPNTEMACVGTKQKQNKNQSFQEEWTAAGLISW